MLIQLFYTSLSRSLRGHPSDFVILRDALENNSRDGVTGYLLRDRARFYEVLEGTAPVVDALFERISADPRHCDICMLMRRCVSQRAFAGWSMGYANLSPEDRAWFDGGAGRNRGAVVVQFDRLARQAGARAALRR